MAYPPPGLPHVLYLPYRWDLGPFSGSWERSAGGPSGVCLGVWSLESSRKPQEGTPSLWM